MVLRKSPPPGIHVPSRTRNGSVHRSPGSPQPATQHARKDSWELDSETDSIYSPDLHTSPAFDLMPLEEAQKSPAGQSPWEDELVERPPGMPHVAATTQSGAAADQVAGNASGMNYQHSGLSQGDNAQRQPAGDAMLGTSPQRFRSNNPFLRARNPSPNPWEGASGQGSSTHSLQPDASERNSQTSGIIPMTARLSIFDEPEDPWGQPGNQPLAQNATPSPQPALHESSENERLSSNTSNLYPGQNGQELDSANHWQEPVLTGSNTSASQPIPQATEQLIDLEDSPTNNEANPWSGEQQSTAQNSKAEDRPSSHQSASTPAPLPPMSEAELKSFQEKQAETYAIRHVNWTDHTGNLRESPVLVQSRNGPCPLLALVNGLIMRSDRDAQPPIVRALQTREHISLGLLIQALFDELVTYSNEDLPDIEALSRFLTMLHTGMNVNPRLTLESPTAVGSFFETKDLVLYDSFKVPLVHGWIAAPTSDVHDSMTRVGQYYEDIQLLHFRKEELEDRVLHSGHSLSPDEQRLMGDIQIITRFVSIENTTQLTGFGLSHLSKTLPPGSVSIFFRNDHFSTLYKHPQSGQLFTLITDAGYADHAEVVWESLVDVKGSDAEFFAGDFRPVGHGPSGSSPPGSQLVAQRTSSRNHSGTPSSSQHNTEQEDADYAYALSLQWQEEAQQQQERPPRRRSSSNRVPVSNNIAIPPRNPTPGHRYSQSATSSSLNSNRNPSVSSPSLQIPPHRNNDTTNLNGIAQDDGPAGGDDDLADDAPPPSYEQVARNKAAELRKRQQQQHQQQQYQSQQYPYASSPSILRSESGRRNQYPGASTAVATGRRQPLQTVPDRGSRSERDKECIVM